MHNVSLMITRICLVYSRDHTISYENNFLEGSSIEWSYECMVEWKKENDEYTGTYLLNPRLLTLLLKTTYLRYIIIIIIIHETNKQINKQANKQTIKFHRKVIPSSNGELDMMP